MVLRMKNFNILAVHCKHWLLRRVLKKNQDRARGNGLKRGAWIVCWFKMGGGGGGLGKTGGGVFEVEGGRLIPQWTLCILNPITQTFHKVTHAATAYSPTFLWYWESSLWPLNGRPNLPNNIIMSTIGCSLSRFFWTSLSELLVNVTSISSLEPFKWAMILQGIGHVLLCSDWHGSLECSFSFFFTGWDCTWSMSKDWE